MSDMTNWTVKVEEVVSSGVCIVLCLNHEQEADQINTWHYNKVEQVCQCGWIESTKCPENLALIEWNLTDTVDSNINDNAFVALKKTLPCGKHSVVNVMLS